MMEPKEREQPPQGAILDMRNFRLYEAAGLITGAVELLAAGLYWLAHPDLDAVAVCQRYRAAPVGSGFPPSETWRFRELAVCLAQQELAKSGLLPPKIPGPQAQANPKLPPVPASVPEWTASVAETMTQLAAAAGHWEFDVATEDGIMPVAEMLRTADTMGGALPPDRIANGAEIDAAEALGRAGRN